MNYRIGGALVGLLLLWSSLGLGPSLGFGEAREFTESVGEH